MSDNQDGQLKPHEFDGIREYDNPLPTWWLFTFFITIIFGGIYWIHYELGGAQTQMMELKEDLKIIEATQKSRPAKEDSEEDLQKLVAVGDAKTMGKGVFDAKCSACHGNELQGLIGPNLTDEYWIHGKGKLLDILSVVRKGVLDKGMPAWEGQIKEDELKAVTIYVASKIGSNPANAKAPQGEKVVSQ